MDFIHDKKILIVDDDEGIRNMIRVILGKEQFRCLDVAETGTDAVRHCREWQPDLVILDIMLPDMDGYEVCRRIREFSMCPVLFLSAKSEETDRIISYTIGGDDYITKPFSPKELVAHINAILRRQSYYEGRSDTSSSYSFGEFTLDFDRRELLRGQAPVALTAREYLLLEYLVRNRNIPLRPFLSLIPTRNRPSNRLKAAPDSWFSHLAVEAPGENGSNEWLEAVDDSQYGILK